MYFESARYLADSLNPMEVLVLDFFWATASMHSGSVIT